MGGREKRLSGEGGGGGGLYPTPLARQSAVAPKIRAFREVMGRRKPGGGASGKAKKGPILLRTTSKSAADRLPLLRGTVGPESENEPWR